MIANNSNDPLVSVIVITYNSANYVIETLDSIKSQTYSNIELIVTDDCSNDSTIKITKEWLDKYSSRFLSTKLIETDKNTGIAQNCNRGIAASEGEWVKIIAGDDALNINTIEKYIDYARRDKDISAIFSDIKAYDELLEPHKEVNIESNKNEKFNDPNCSVKEQFQILLRFNCVNAPTVMLKRKVVDQVGGFDERFPFLEDWPMWLSLTKAGHKMYYVNIVSVKYRIHTQSVQGLYKKETYKGRAEMEVDKMFLKLYMNDLPFMERIARFMTIYRDKIIIKIFDNRNNKFISGLSKTFGVVPNFMLKQYKRKFLK